MKSNGTAKHSSPFQGFRQLILLESAGWLALCVLAWLVHTIETRSWRARLAQAPRVGVEQLLEELSQTHVRSLPSRSWARRKLSEAHASSNQGNSLKGTKNRSTNRELHAVRERGVKRSNIPLNASSAEDWDELPGIGPVLSKRIVAYRQSIGGFASITQLHHVYGLDSAIIESWSARIVLDTALITGVCVDSVTFGWLARHPEFGPEAARRILSARGRGVEDVEVLRQRLRANQEEWLAWRPYLMDCPSVDSLQ